MDFDHLNCLINILIKNWWKSIKNWSNLIWFCLKLDKFNWKLVKTDQKLLSTFNCNPILMSDLESDWNWTTKLLDSEFNSWTIRFGMAYCRSLPVSIESKLLYESKINSLSLSFKVQKLKFLWIATLKEIILLHELFK